MKPKVLVLDNVHALLLNALQGMGYECIDHRKSDLDTVYHALEDCSGILIRSRFKVDAAFMDKGPHLRFIARWGVGTEHIDLEAAAARDIAVLTSAEGSRDTVGEHTIALLLNLMNHISRAHQEIRQGSWIREGNRAVELKGKTVGIIGYGNMGQAFARRLAGFEVTVLAYDKYKTGYGDAFAKEASLEQIWEESDVVSLHIPYMASNHYFVDGAFLDRFQKNIYLINTARGLVLHTADLVSRLQSGKVTGAALDVIEYEETSFNKLDPATLPAPFQYLRSAPNVVLTPHIAGWSFEAEEKHAQVLAAKIAEIGKIAVGDLSLRG